MSTAPRRVVFSFHQGVPTREPRLDQARKFLKSEGVELWEGISEDRASVATALRRAQLLVTFGGDGTLLHSARSAVGLGVPVLGVNLGRLGFLTATDLDGFQENLEAALDGRLLIERRTVIRWTTDRHPRGGLAVNEVAVRMRGAQRLIRIAAEIGGPTGASPLGTFDADGAIVATASGSTAYSMSAGGPILQPGLPNLVLTPLNAFTLSTRSLVLAPEQVVTLWSPGSRSVATADGQVEISLGQGERISLTANREPMLLLRPQADGFYRLLREKIRWGTSLIP